jgi:hypothetical protein
MIFEIRFTSEAEETYFSVTSQLRERWGQHFLDKFETKVSKVLGIISKTPDIYHVDKQFAQLRKCILHKNCSMLYKVNDDYITIAYFWDNRREPLMLP